MNYIKHRTIYLLVLAVMSVGIFSCKKLPSEETLSANSKLQAEEGSTFVSNPKNLNIVMFVPTDNPAVSGYQSRLSTLFTHFQTWFHNEMLRYGYDKYMGLARNDSTGLVRIIEIHAQGAQTDYPYSSSVSATKIINEINTYRSSHPAEFSNSGHMLILLPQRSDGGDQPFYGYGKYCFAVDNSSMAVDKIPNPNSNYLGGMLHELGHGLNLAHNHAKYASEQQSLGTSLMGSGNVSFSKGQPTFLTEGDAAILNCNEIFQNPSPIETAYQSSSTSIYANSSTFDSAAQVFQLNGTFTSSLPVSDVIVYLDPNVNNEGVGANKDYNAVSWRFNPNTGNTLAGSIPLNELYYKNNEPYEFKVKLLLNNGNLVTQTYTFNFLNGIPQIGANGTGKFYQNASYGGYSVSLPVGDYTTADLIAKGIKDNDISSVSVDLGVKIILYDGDNFTGTSFELNAASSYLSTFNDKASSIRVIAL
ncbi:hypothetical protein ACJVDH_12135 [Pedobacter sp. AW1-32]|uniref:hypothetical protein n=1 Tax=Pedobacter sp. AW1-32 TaxID=3383026 RepID=UPI003FEDAA1D